VQITPQTAGNGVVTNRTYDPNTGLTQTIQAGVSNAVANYAFAFNQIGTLTSRTDAIGAVTENFTYDTMNRLTQYAIAGGSTKTVGYNGLGNITSKSDVGTYTYPAAGLARPHAVGSITGAINTIFTYDANGNMLAGQGRTVTYTSFNMSASITQGSSTVTLTYDANHARIKQVAPDGTTIYVAGPAGVERFAATSGLVTWNEYLSAGGQLVGVHFSRSDTTQATRHFVTDHLGSVAVLTDEMGAVVERLAYDAWGKRRYPNGADDPAGAITSQTTKGFTGHEHIAAVGLINMNARVYDPVIGRFMTADSVVQDIYLSQILNRYSYVNNNPLSLTDPSGHFIAELLGALFVGAILAPIIKEVPIIGSLYVIGVSIACGPAGPICGAVASAAVTGIQGGDLGDMLKAAVLSYAQAVAFNAVGDLLGKAPTMFERFFAHGVVGGTLSELQGGSFQSGFLSAGIASLAHGVHLGGRVEDTALRAVLGGIGSVAGGGKFENGAITAAFAYLYNDWRHGTLGYRAQIELLRWHQQGPDGNRWSGNITCLGFFGNCRPDFVYKNEDGSWDIWEMKPAGQDAVASAEAKKYVQDVVEDGKLNVFLGGSDRILDGTASLSLRITDGFGYVTFTYLSSGPGVVTWSANTANEYVYLLRSLAKGPAGGFYPLPPLPGGPPLPMPVPIR
jgi:RHS repeat-associated protein